MSKQKVKIPEGWKEVKLNDVVEKMKTGGTPPSSVKEYYEGDISFVKIDDMTRGGKYVCKTKTKINEIAIKNSSAWLVPEYSLLYSIYATVGEVSINTLPVATNQAIMGIVPDKLKISRDYLYYYLVFLKNKISKFFKETTQKNLTSEIVKNLSILLPPLATQNKIAEILGAVDEEIDGVNSVIVKSEKLKDGVYYNFLNKTSKTETIKLGQLLDFKNGINFSKEQKGGVGILTVDVLNMYGGLFVETSNLYRVDKNIGGDYLLKRGDILFVRSSVKKDGVGFPSLFNGFNEPLTFCGFIIKGCLKDKKVLPEYIVYLLRSKKYRDLVVSCAGSTAITNIGQTVLGNIKIKIPSKELQQEFVDVLLTIDNKISIYKKIKNNLIQLKKGLMGDLLSGNKMI